MPHSPELLAAIKELLPDELDIFNFLAAYGELAKAVDDLVDEGYSVEKFERVNQLQIAVHSSKYWQRRGHELWLVEKLINLTYFDAVQWEHATEEWKRRDARALNHCGYNMLFAIIMLENPDGYNACKKISLQFRESCHISHKDDPI